MELKPFEEKVWLASPMMHGEEQKYVKEAFDKNWVSTVGENIDEVERITEEYLGVENAVALSSGTAALHMAVKLAGEELYGKPKIGEGALAGKKVFCSDLTFSATVNPVSYEKGEQVFIDSEYDTWNMDPKALEKAFEKYPDVKVVIAVNLYGVPAKLDEIKSICSSHDAILIEDAAESLGATYKDGQTGTFGTYNAISFNGNKIITTSGGGMLLTDAGAAALEAKKLATQAREEAPWYQHENLGYNYRMSNILAGIGRGQLRHLDEHIDRKKEIYLRYKDGFKDLPITMNPCLEDIMKPNYWLSCLLIAREAMCRQVRSDSEALYKKEKGCTCPTEILQKLATYNAEGRPIWKPMHMQPVYHQCGFVSVKDGISVSEDIFERGMCLPSDIKMTEVQQDMVIEMVRSCFG